MPVKFLRAGLGFARRLPAEGPAGVHGRAGDLGVDEALTLPKRVDESICAAGADDRSGSRVVRRIVRRPQRSDWSVALSPSRPDH
jgi:hypothetical protein